MNSEELALLDKEVRLAAEEMRDACAELVEERVRLFDAMSSPVGEAVCRILKRLAKAMREIEP